MYAQYSGAVSNQERVMMAHVRYYEVGYSSDLQRHTKVFPLVSLGGFLSKGAFNDYVNKKRWAAGPKFPVVQFQGEKCPP